MYTLCLFNIIMVGHLGQVSLETFFLNVLPGHIKVKLHKGNILRIKMKIKTKSLNGKIITCKWAFDFYNKKIGYPRFTLIKAYTQIVETIFCFSWFNSGFFLSIFPHVYPLCLCLRKLKL